MLVLRSPTRIKIGGRAGFLDLFVIWEVETVHMVMLLEARRTISATTAERCGDSMSFERDQDNQEAHMRLWFYSSCHNWSKHEATLLVAYRRLKNWPQMVKKLATVIGRRLLFWSTQIKWQHIPVKKWRRKITSLGRDSQINLNPAKGIVLHE